MIYFYFLLLVQLTEDYFGLCLYFFTVLLAGNDKIVEFRFLFCFEVL